MRIDDDDGLILLLLCFGPVRVDNLFHCDALSASGLSCQSHMFSHLLAADPFEESINTSLGSPCADSPDGVSFSSFDTHDQSRDKKICI